jgi:hypothetical protein
MRGMLDGWGGCRGGRVAEAQDDAVQVLLMRQNVHLATSEGSHTEDT